LSNCTSGVLAVGAREKAWESLAEAIDETENDINTNKTVARHVPVHNHLKLSFPFISESALNDMGCEEWLCLSQAV
jgi:hypothetical protein